ncbi:DUF624 domain-containing protein [Aquibacillus rhizosphaerae]|uniref:DUF624 domain-containing protein n=1 Tax=Aquibacillus rhizosphaerae TaxID=3051431 RepID=A0ABT7L7R1_9BACI|nr:DUF624 domain-containing protein [Aquibacillus sp. LR5S19]MDL4841898.1 DUF624 domain-containing protein [Aquibacillus sp. LR5S19]
MSTPMMDRPIYMMTKYMYAFFVTNLYFLLCNLLFFIVYFLADFTFQNIILFYLTMIPMGPSITAVLSAMGKLVREKDVSPSIEFWKAYKRNFWVTMKYWFIQLTIIFILIIDIYYATTRINFISPLFFLFLLASLFVMMYALPVITRFEVKLKNLLIVSIYSNFKFFKTTVLNVSSIVAFGFTFYFFPSIGSLFFVSLIGFFIMFNLQVPFRHMENEMSEKNK